MTTFDRDHLGYMGKCPDCSGDLYQDEAVEVTFPDHQWICPGCKADRDLAEAEAKRVWEQLNMGPLVPTFAVGHPLTERYVTGEGEK